MTQDLEQQAVEGDNAAAKSLAELAYRRKDYKEAVKWYEMAANRGDGYSAYSLGHIYFEDGPNENEEKAAHWFKIAAEKGEPDAQYKLSLMYFNGNGGLRKDYKEAARLCRLAANQDHPKALAQVQDLEMMASRSSGSSCIIATACTGATSAEVNRLRQLRDSGISADPIVRDFLHVFWSRYYEYSPGVARLAETDGNVARHIRWSFMEPWFAWLELVARVGRRGSAELDARQRADIIDALTNRVQKWVSQLPEQLEGKRPADDATVFEAFEAFRATALSILGERK